MADAPPMLTSSPSPDPPLAVEPGLHFHRSSIRVKYIRCGRRDCGRCPHGPYLYRVWRDGHRVRTEYIGRAFALADSRGRADDASTREPHPYKAGDSVRFLADAHPYWITLVGLRPTAHEDCPPMRVAAVGWGRFGRKGSLYAYVTLETTAGVPVHHPYDATFCSPDPAGRLDRRFPVPLVERV